MFVQYINKESHTIVDGSKEYVFNCNDIKEMSDKLGIYICSKYRNSFKKANELKKEIKKIKDTVREMVFYILYTKKANSTKWISIKMEV